MKIEINENTYYTVSDIVKLTGYSPCWVYNSFKNSFIHKCKKNGKVCAKVGNRKGFVSVISGKDFVEYFKKNGKRGKIIHQKNYGIEMAFDMNKWSKRKGTVDTNIISKLKSDIEVLEKKNKNYETHIALLEKMIRLQDELLNGKK